MKLVSNRTLTDTAGASAGEFLDKNALTAAGAVVGVGAAVAGIGVATAVAPAPMLAAGVISGGLIYAGDRQDKGLDIFANPFAEEEKAEAAV